MSCPECGSDDLITEFDGDAYSITCYACGTVVDDPSKENESMEEDEEDECDNYDDEDDSKEVPLTKATKRTDESDSNVMLSNNTKEDLSLLQANGTSEFSQQAENEKRETTVPTCDSCGGTNLISDSIHAMEHLVCEDCGAFSERQELVSSQDFANIGGSSAVYQWSRAPGPKFMNVDSQINKGKVYGAQVIRNMSSQLNWQTYLTDQTLSMYEQLYPHKLVKYTTNSFKDALCVACMYSVARENKIKLTLKTLIGLKNVKTKFVTKALRLLKTISKKPLAHQTLPSLTEHVLAGCDFSADFVTKVGKLVHVCEKGFVTQGRNHSHVVTAVAHLVWIAEDHKQRKSVSLIRFCSQHNLRHTRHLTLQQKAIKELFMTLARQLPWVTASITNSNYLHYLDSIATYGLSVVSRASRQTSANGQQSPHSCSGSSGEGEVAATPSLPNLLPPSMKTRRSQSGARAESPPRLPAHLTAADLDKEDLYDSEFSDQEISAYILTPSEVHCKQTLTQRDMDCHTFSKKQG